MANWSDTDITLIGATEDIEKAHKFLQDLIDDEWLDGCDLKPDDSIESRAGYTGLEVYDYTHTLDNIQISGSGRWCGPHLLFKELANNFNLDLNYHDSESGCDFYHHISIVDGKEAEDVEHSYNSIPAIEHRGVDYFEEDLYSWYWEDEDSEIDTELEKLIDYFKLERTDIPLYKELTLS